jgi:hypothetical protein
MSDDLPIIGHAGASDYVRKRFGVVRSPATFAKYACRGCPGGVPRPKFHKAGRDVLYYPKEPGGLDDFAVRLIRDPAECGKAA